MRWRASPHPHPGQALCRCGVATDLPGSRTLSTPGGTAAFLSPEGALPPWAWGIPAPSHSYRCPHASWSAFLPCRPRRAPFRRQPVPHACCLRRLPKGWLSEMRRVPPPPLQGVCLNPNPTTAQGSVPVKAGLPLRGCHRLGLLGPGHLAVESPAQADPRDWWPHPGPWRSPP